MIRVFEVIAWGSSSESAFQRMQYRDTDELFQASIEVDTDADSTTEDTSTTAKAYIVRSIPAVLFKLVTDQATLVISDSLDQCNNKVSHYPLCSSLPKGSRRYWTRIEQ